MKKALSIFTFTLLVLPVIYAQEIKWMSWEEAMEANKKSPKKIFVDVYTDWCGWCKVMDKNTFSDSTVVAYMNTNFYNVKLNAEQKKDIVWNNTTFKYRPEYKSHDMAISLLDGQMSYPSYVVLDEKIGRLKIMKGYMEKSPFLEALYSIVSK